MRRILCLFASPIASTPPIAFGAGTFKGTAGIVEKQHQTERSVVLEDVRLGRHAGYDRIVFEFRHGSMPGYHIEYIDKPAYSCGSGEAVWLAGDGWLRVSFDATQAHDDQGRSTVGYRGRVVNLPIVKEVQNTCDFKGEGTWVLGVSSPNNYRVLKLKHPTRLVVDIKHEPPSSRLTPP
jgi:hypothetical protein